MKENDIAQRSIDRILERAANKPKPPIPFTPGVPTEDGWYVVKVRFSGIDSYETINVTKGASIHPNADAVILSHAKLPEL